MPCICAAAFPLCVFTRRVSGARSDSQATYQCPRDACRELFIATRCHAIRGVHIGAHGRGSSRFAWNSSSGAAAIIVRGRNREPVAAVCADPRTGDGCGGDAPDRSRWPGVRQSLEFLIKGLFDREGDAAAAEIKRESLGTTIANRVDDANVKACAKRAAWLRNDETHYERVFVDADLADLKKLILLTVNWILVATHSSDHRGYARKASPGTSVRPMQADTSLLRPEVFGTVAEWFTAIGTIGAVVVALYFGMRDRRSRVRLSSVPELDLQRNVIAQVQIRSSTWERPGFPPYTRSAKNGVGFFRASDGDNGGLSTQS